MARKTFVSTKKNAPTQAASSKEAALRSRQLDSEKDDEGEEKIRIPVMPHSPASSADSSVISSDDDDDDDDDLMDNDDENEEEGQGERSETVSVEVMPSTTFRGKQLRLISRGKESRVTRDGSEYATSDSESAGGMDDSEDEDVIERDEDGGELVVGTDIQPVPGQNHAVVAREEAQAEEDIEEVTYPIKALRARKRHRPDSDHFTDYFRQMATHVRDCLLSVRDGAGAADVFREETHREFRRKLETGTVSRVEWREASPEPNPLETEDEEKTSASTDTSKDSKQSKESSKKDARKKEERKKEHSGKNHSSSKQHRHKSAKEKKDNDSETSSKSLRRSPTKKRSERTQSHRHSRTDKTSKSVKKTDEDKKTEHMKRKIESDQSTEGVKRVKEVDPIVDVPMKAAPAEENHVMEITVNAVKTTAATNGTLRQVRQATEPSEQLCASCRRRLNDVREEVKEEVLPPLTVTPAPQPPVPTGSFMIPTSSTKDIRALREQAGKLNEEARKLKHEGNGKGTGTVEQGKDYLRSCVKFFQHALVLSDIKSAYKDLNDMNHARSYGDASIETLRQTSSLVENTIRTFQTAKNARLVALAYKMAAIVHLTIYRLQHLKLSSLYADLTPAGRSPDTRQNGTTPPIIPNGTDSQETAIRSHLMKEMRHMLRGFEMWRRYEAMHTDVLPRITNPIVMDLNVFFEDLPAALDEC